MIASPSDVEAERNIIREVLHEWNDVHSKPRKIAFMPVAWETHAAPGLEGRPQASINKHLLQDCDLLVGVFWTRIGTPTGTEQSGTVEEIKMHHAAGKPAMLYFSSAPLSPNKVDPKQNAKVTAFKAWSKKKGLIEEYGSVEEFRDKLKNQLQLTLQRSEYLRSILDESDPMVHDFDSMAFSAPPLSADAQDLLLTASGDGNGQILALTTLGGYRLQAGGRSFGSGHGRERARWKGALEELEELGYVQDQGYKGEMFELTNAGWEAADQLRAVADETGEDDR